MEDQSHKESHISPEISKPSSKNLTTWIKDKSGLFTYVKGPSGVDMWPSIHPSHEDSSNLPLKLSNLDDTIASFNRQKFIWLSRAIQSFYTDMSTQPSVCWSTSPIFQHEESGWLYIVKTDSQKDDEIIRWYGTNPILHQINFVEPFLYAYQETPQDSQKREILERFAMIAQREDNWDGYDSKKPTELTINRAERFIKELLNNQVISARFLQLDPFICSDEDGYITVECYKGKRSLCFDIQEDETKYTKIWRTGANTMTQTDSLNPDNYLPLWEWFFDE